MKKIILILFFSLSLVYSSDFNLKTIDNKILHIDINKYGFDFKEYKGKPVYLIFFGTQCLPCTYRIPVEMEEAEREGAKIIGIQAQMFNVPTYKIKKMQRELNMNFPIIKNEEASKLIQFLDKNGLWIGGVPYILKFDNNGFLINKNKKTFF